MKVKKHRRNYTAQFKSKVALEAHEGCVSALVISKRYGIHPNLICQWKKSLVENSHCLFEDSHPEKDDRDRQIEALNKKVESLSKDVEFLKKQLVDLSPNKRKTMINKEVKEPSVRRQCDLLSVCRRTLYYKPVGESDENLEILLLLDRQYLETPYYGERRLLALLREKGYNINIKRVRRLMRIVRWCTLYPKKRTTQPDRKALKHPYLLRDLTVDRSNQVWAIDITYVPMKRGYMYLFAIIDLYSRYVVGWDISNSMTSEWCVGVLKDAMERHGKPEIVNSDQGSQFTSDKYIDFLKTNNVKISMDGKGRALDNSFIERLWRSVKQEHVYLNLSETGTDLWRGLNDYFQFYNTKRLHQSLGHKSPEKLYKPVNKTA